MLASSDQRTAGHSSRVTRLVGRLCRALELPEQETAEIVLAAGLHDVGKMGVDRSILDKKGPLTDEEWSCIKEHVRIGEHILAALGYVDHIIPMVGSHHERYDGLGYPRGLKGEEIPLGGRLIAIADAYDAMTSHRSYRSAMGRDQALAQLWANAGTQFDPHLVELFCHITDSEPQPSARCSAALSVEQAACCQ